MSPESNHICMLDYICKTFAFYWASPMKHISGSKTKKYVLFEDCFRKFTFH